MKNLYFLLTVLLSFGVFGQDCYNLEWVNNIGGTVNDKAYALTVDAQGNSYVTGYFRNSTSFGSTTLTSSGEEDFFVAKLDEQGNFLWVRKGGGIGFDQGYSIALDVNGNVYVTGKYEYSAVFGSVTITSEGGHDVFIAKYSSTGILQWVRSAGGSGSDYGYSIAVDNQGNAYITGEFLGGAYFNTLSLTSTSYSSDIFIAKLNTNGSFLWARRAGGSGVDIGRSISLDQAGNVYVAGNFSNTATFGSISRTSAGLEDGFIVKLNSLGEFDWVKTFGGIGNDRVRSIVLDNQNNLYITGNFSNTVSFGSTNLTSAGQLDMFVSKLDSQGNFLWTKHAGGNGEEAGNSIAVDSNGDIYVAGFYFSNAVIFGNSTVNNLGVRDIVIIKLDNQGNFVWTKSYGGSGDDVANSIAVDSQGNAFVGGYFTGNAFFGNTSKSSNGGNDIFVTKLKSIQTESILNITNCGGYTLNGQTYNASGIYTQTLINSQGCDSIITLNLTINPITTSIINASSCGSYTLNGQTYVTSGIYTQILSNSQNCDSIITLNLTVNSSTSSILNITNCGAYTLNGEIFSSSGTYTQIIPNSHNCDSIITLNLVINSVDSTITRNGSVFTANQSNAAYQWLDCGNGNTPIAGANAQSFTPSANGIYAVQVTANGCTKISECLMITDLSISSTIFDAMRLYPNPANANAILSNAPMGAELIVADVTGKILFKDIINSEKVIIPTSSLDKGIYLINVTHKGERTVSKLEVSR